MVQVVASLPHTLAEVPIFPARGPETLVKPASGIERLALYQHHVSDEPSHRNRTIEFGAMTVFLR